jgi:hypothetical protein
MADRWRLLEQQGIAVVPILDNPAPDFQVYECVAVNSAKLSECSFDRASAVSRSGAGFQKRAAELANVVAVDMTPPSLELFPLEQGRGKNADKVMISWKCTDEFLPERPVALFYSSTGEAPWIPISGAIENTGSYAWDADSGTNPRIYLRIEARDLAGNVQIAQSQQPVVVDLARPTAKIIDVESPAESGVPRD